MPRPKKERRLPSILGKEETYRLLNTVENIKHRAILLLTYCFLRTKKLYKKVPAGEMVISGRE